MDFAPHEPLTLSLTILSDGCSVSSEIPLRRASVGARNGAWRSERAIDRATSGGPMRQTFVSTSW